MYQKKIPTWTTPTEAIIDKIKNKDNKDDTQKSRITTIIGTQSTISTKIGAATTATKSW